VAVGNIGCYGQEASKVVLRAEVFNIEKGSIEIWTTNDFNFGYRSTRLNKDLKNKFAVLAVYFKLQKSGQPNISYVDLKKYFVDHAEVAPSLVSVREALREIRGWKFPKIGEQGSDGSFFKNLLLNSAEVETLDQNIAKNFPAEIQEKYVAIKNKFPMEGVVKIPSAFLMDICGLKNLRVGDAVLWERQPLVIVNATQAAKASDVAGLFRQVRQIIFEKTGMKLESEPEWVGFSDSELAEYLKLS
jgi:UDP-N-acetylmuramate dehydrogenase